MFYGLPIAFDLTGDVPDYHSTPGFRAGATDESVAVVYDLFVAACPIRAFALSPFTMRAAVASFRQIYSGIRAMPEKHA